MVGGGDDLMSTGYRIVFLANFQESIPLLNFGEGSDEAIP